MNLDLFIENYTNNKYEFELKDKREEHYREALENYLESKLTDTQFLELSLYIDTNMSLVKYDEDEIECLKELLDLIKLFLN